MESAVLTAKFVLFLALEVFVVATVGAVLILWIYCIVRNRVHESGYLSEIVHEVRGTGSAGLPVGHEP